MPGLISVDVEASVNSFRFNQAELEHLLKSPSGGVGRDLVRRAIRVEAQAKINASSPPPSQPGHGPAVRTGRLRSSITWRLGEDSLSIYADIGSAVFYAPFLEQGTSRMAARPFLRPALVAAQI